MVASETPAQGLCLCPANYNNTSVNATRSIRRANRRHFENRAFRRATNLYDGGDTQSCIENCRQSFFDSLLGVPSSANISDSSYSQACPQLASTDNSEDLWQLYWCDSAFCGVSLSSNTTGQDSNVDLVISNCQSIGHTSVSDPGPPPPDYSCNQFLSASSNPCFATALPTSSTTPTMSSTPTATSTPASTPTESAVDTAASSSDNTPVGIKAGVIVGVVSAFLVLAGAVFILLRRRRRERSSKAGSSDDDYPDSQVRNIPSGLGGGGIGGGSAATISDAGFKSRLRQSQLSIVPGGGRDESGVGQDTPLMSADDLSLQPPSLPRGSMSSQNPSPTTTLQNSPITWSSEAQQAQQVPLVQQQAQLVQQPQQALAQPTSEQRGRSKLQFSSTLFRRGDGRSSSPPLTSLSPPPSPGGSGNRSAALPVAAAAAAASTSAAAPTSSYSIPYTFPSSPICAPTTNRLEPRQEMTSIPGRPASGERRADNPSMSHVSTLPPSLTLPHVEALMAGAIPRQSPEEAQQSAERRWSFDPSIIDALETAPSSSFGHALTTNEARPLSASPPLIPPYSEGDTVAPLTLTGPARPPRSRESLLAVPGLGAPGSSNGGGSTSLSRDIDQWQTGTDFGANDMDYTSSVSSTSSRYGPSAQRP